MIDLRSLHNTLWLAEPTALRLAVLRVASYPTCPTARELAKARRKALDAAEALPSRALESSGHSFRDEMKLEAPRQLRAVKGKVGILPMHGPIEQRLTPAGMKAGGSSTEAMSRGLDALLAYPQIGAIVLHADSPGGTSHGIEELGDKLYAARGRKPIYCAVDSVCCSAAYWLGSACEMMVCTPGGDVGSVGVYAMHIDQSEEMTAKGVKVSLVKAGKYKAEGNPFEPLGEEAMANLQEQVDATYQKFTGALSRNRGVPVSTVRSSYGQGRVMNAEQALAAGMVDRVLSFEGLMARLTGNPTPFAGMRQPMPQVPNMPGMAASAEVLRLRHQQRKARQWEVPLGKRMGPGLTHDSKVASDEPQWSAVDKAKLPDNAFADEADRSFPHHWAQDGGNLDEDGHYTTGTLWLHREGLAAAWAAANGARSGQQASDAVKKHLEMHRKAIGMGD